MNYRVKLEMFEGPMELLLHLIKKNEVDIYDIPVASIADQYLDYLDFMKELNLDIVGDFFLMAATLIYIKSKMLLPVTEEESDGEEAGDPREELIERLIEYRKYKERAEILAERQILGRDVFKRGSNGHELTDQDSCSISDISVFSLVDALKHVLSNIKSGGRSLLNISMEEITVVQRIKTLTILLQRTGSLNFRTLFSKDKTRSDVVITFLAVLELVRINMAGIHHSENGGIRVYIKSGRASVTDLLPA